MAALESRRDRCWQCVEGAAPEHNQMVRVAQEVLCYSPTDHVMTAVEYSHDSTRIVSRLHLNSAMTALE